MLALEFARGHRSLYLFVSKSLSAPCADTGRDQEIIRNPGLRRNQELSGCFWHFSSIWPKGSDYPYYRRIPGILRHQPGNLFRNPASLGPEQVRVQDEPGLYRLRLFPHGPGSLRKRRATSLWPRGPDTPSQTVFHSKHPGGSSTMTGETTL